MPVPRCASAPRHAPHPTPQRRMRSALFITLALALALVLLPARRRRQLAPARDLPGRRAAARAAATRVREATLDEIRGLGADMIKVQLDWATSAPGGRAQARRLRRHRPGAVPGLGRLRRVLAAAQARGFQVMFALSAAGARAGPRAARAGRYESVDRPSAREFGRFAEAAARRFPGVDVWSLWNEPNLAKYLYPQSRSGVPVRAARLPRHGARRRGRPAPRRRRRRPGPVRRAAADRQPSAGPQEQPAAAPLPARVLLPRLAATGRSAAAPPACAAARATSACGPRRLRLPPLHAARRARPDRALVATTPRSARSGA